MNCNDWAPCTQPPPNYILVYSSPTGIHLGTQDVLLILQEDNEGFPVLPPDKAKWKTRFMMLTSPVSAIQLLLLLHLLHPLGHLHLLQLLGVSRTCGATAN